MSAHSAAARLAAQADKEAADKLARSRLAEGLADEFECNADEITPQLWLGNEDAAQDLQVTSALQFVWIV